MRVALESPAIKMRGFILNRSVRSARCAGDDGFAGGRSTLSDRAENSFFGKYSKKNVKSRGAVFLITRKNDRNSSTSIGKIVPTTKQMCVLQIGPLRNISN